MGCVHVMFLGTCRDCMIAELHADLRAQRTERRRQVRQERRQRRRTRTTSGPGLPYRLAAGRDDAPSPWTRRARGRRAAVTVAWVLALVVVAPRLWWWATIGAAAVALVLLERRRRRGGGSLALRVGAADVTTWLIGAGAWVVSTTLTRAGAATGLATELTLTGSVAISTAALEVAVLAVLGWVLAQRFARTCLERSTDMTPGRSTAFDREDLYRRPSGRDRNRGHLS